jgi:UDP-N-acetylmuramyl tripeptide synthase
MGKLPMRARLATTIGGAAGTMSRLAGRGDGSVIGGVIGLRLEPDLLALLSAGRQIVLVTGTNGKTTTTRLITAALGALGQDVASNAFGANMEAGLAAASSRTESTGEQHAGSGTFLHVRSVETAAFTSSDRI